MSGIRLSEKHGINPSISVCYFCQDDKNEIAIPGRLPNDAQAPRSGVWDMEPCDKCKGYMQQGIILIEIRDGELEKVESERQTHQLRYDRMPASRRPLFFPNPYRTGGWWVVAEDAIRRLMRDQTEPLARVLECRWAFVTQTDASNIGLRRPEESEQPDG